MCGRDKTLGVLKRSWLLRISSQLASYALVEVEKGGRSGRCRIRTWLRGKVPTSADRRICVHVPTHTTTTESGQMRDSNPGLISDIGARVVED